MRILSLDGGGVRGLIQLSILERIEVAFAPLKLTSLFDLIAGTSVGGIIALAILKGIKLSKLREFVLELASQILDVNRVAAFFRMAANMGKCDTAKFEDALEELFGPQRLRCASDPPFAFATAFDQNANKTVLLGNLPAKESLDHWQEFNEDERLSSIWREWKEDEMLICITPLFAAAARATSAAPTFFEPKHEYLIGRESCGWSFVDGGVAANCPAGLAVKAVKERSMGGKATSECIEMIVSLGTGLPKPDVVPTTGNALHWAGRLVDMATDSEKLWESEIASKSEFRDVNLVRMNPPDLGSLNGFTSESIPDIEKGTAEYLESEEGSNVLDKLLHVTFAKLWKVDMRSNLIVDEPKTFEIKLRDISREYFDGWTPKMLYDIILRAPHLLEPATDTDER